tara:strand:- start:180 stop:428 length:249 start_codon:yes stop_codon:yes gene_type:complete
MQNKIILICCDIIELMKLKLNADLASNKSGDIVEVRESFGIPTSKYWRQRIKDSAVDNCVEIIKQKKIVRKKIEKEVLNDNQ